MRTDTVCGWVRTTVILRTGRTDAKQSYHSEAKLPTQQNGYCGLSLYGQHAFKDGISLQNGMYASIFHCSNRPLFFQVRFLET
jgi:hypothetical protein